MKKLVLKIFLLATIVVVLSSVLTHVALPVFWAHPAAQAKLNYWKKHEQQYNAAFVGSSRIFHHVIPARFDSLGKAEGYDIHAFNMGVNSFPMPESFRMVDQLEDAPGLKYLYLEATPVYYNVAGELLHTPKYYYWYDFSQLTMLCEHVKCLPAPPKRKLKFCEDHVLSWVEKNLFIGGAQTLFTSMNGDEQDWIEAQCGSGDGFISFDAEGASGPYVKETAQRRKEFLRDTTILGKRRADARKFDGFKPENGCTPYTSYLKDMYDRFSARGVQVFLVITPRLGDYKALNGLLAGIPSSHIIDLSSPDRFPEFYSFENSFDRGHMNTHGAELFTDTLFRLSLQQHP